MIKVLVEIPFSVVRDHATVRYLSPVSYGCYCRLMYAAFVDGVDILNAPITRWMEICLCRPGVWARIHREVTRAFKETYPIMAEEYGNQYRVAKRRHEFYVGIGKKGQQVLKEKRERSKTKLVLISDSPTNPDRDVVLVPQKLPNSRHRPRKDWSDQAKLREISNSKPQNPTLLTDKTPETNQD